MITKGCFHCEVNLPNCTEILTRFGHQLQEVNLCSLVRDLDATLMDCKVSFRFVESKNFMQESKILQNLLLNCSNIEVLRLSKDVIDIDNLFLMKILRVNRKIKDLYLDGYHLTEGCSFKLDQEDLESLWVSDGEFDVKFLNARKLCKSSKIRKLCLRDDAWSKKKLGKPRSILSIHLEQLRIGLPDEIISYFKIISDLLKLTNLKILKINGCDELNDDVLQEVASHCSQLMGIDISYNDNLTDDGLQHLSSLQKLTCLDIGCGPPFTDRALNHVSKFSNLKVLEARNNKFTDVRASVLLRRLENLEILDLDENEQISKTFVILAMKIVKSRKNRNV
ncbi:hypothetical protein QAD02_006250 [Eretmocerus hayati]|uniref:Uncharacterized protein n=1 Tax=Eretmocerus hayati TaxID=131215 RepID=A0ACC2N0T7_9HYME|nr:hypothetical protein QAD02_006250 [Eretmocerus hayati]